MIPVDAEAELSTFDEVVAERDALRAELQRVDDERIYQFGLAEQRKVESRALAEKVRAFIADQMSAWDCDRRDVAAVRALDLSAVLR